MLVMVLACLGLRVSQSWQEMGPVKGSPFVRSKGCGLISYDYWQHCAVAWGLETWFCSRGELGTWW